MPLRRKVVNRPNVTRRPLYLYILLEIPSVILLAEPYTAPARLAVLRQHVYTMDFREEPDFRWLVELPHRFGMKLPV